MSKGEKGLEVAMHLLKTNVPKFMQWKESLGQSISLGKREGWKSEIQMLETIWGKGAADAHCIWQN